MAGTHRVRIAAWYIPIFHRESRRTISDANCFAFFRCVFCMSAADKAVAVPFTEFMGGMQNDKAMPTEGFHPIFVAFIWQAVPYSFFKTEDSLTRAQLLANEEKKQAGGDTDISKAAEAATAAIEEENPDNEALVNEFKVLASNSHIEDDDDDEDDDTKVERLRTEGKVEKEGDTLGERVIDFGLSILNPLQFLVFGRLMGRGQKTGRVMEQVLAKLMTANEGVKTKVCLMANSLGAHVLSGILHDPQHLPHKIHTVFYVQGAMAREKFLSGRKFERICQNVAGPIVCTYSDRDLMLKNIFGPFHGTAIGEDGFATGEIVDMKSLDEMQTEPYKFECAKLNSLNGTKYVLWLSLGYHSERHQLKFCLLANNIYCDCIHVISVCCLTGSSMKAIQSREAMEILRRMKRLVRTGRQSRLKLILVPMTDRRHQLIIALMLMASVKSIHRSSKDILGCREDEILIVVQS